MRQEKEVLPMIFRHEKECLLLQQQICISMNEDSPVENSQQCLQNTSLQMDVLFIHRNSWESLRPRLGKNARRG